jgi:hypothetical protein
VTFDDIEVNDGSADKDELIEDHGELAAVSLWL